MDKTITSMMPTRVDALRHAVDDLNSLANVFGWLDEMLASILDLIKDDESDPVLRLHRINRLADCARYLASDWQNTAGCMADGFERKMGEVRHGE